MGVSPSPEADRGICVMVRRVVAVLPCVYVCVCVCVCVFVYYLCVCVKVRVRMFVWVYLCEHPWGLFGIGLWSTRNTSPGRCSAGWTGEPQGGTSASCIYCGPG